MTTQEALGVVKEYSKNISPYQCELNQYHETVRVITDSREEFLLGLATLVVHLVEKEDV